MKTIPNLFLFLTRAGCECVDKTTRKHQFIKTDLFLQKCRDFSKAFVKKVSQVSNPRQMP